MFVHRSHGIARHEQRVPCSLPRPACRCDAPRSTVHPVDQPVRRPRRRCL